MGFIDGVRAVWDFVSGLGSTILLPLIITIMGLIFGQKLRTALRAGLMLAVGFITLNLVIGLLIGEMVPVVNTMVEDTGANLTILDVGWGVAAGIAWGTKAGSLVVIVCLLTNIIMLALQAGPRRSMLTSGTSGTRPSPRRLSILPQAAIWSWRWSQRQSTQFMNWLSRT